jgi:hypothetical protein
MSRVERDDRDSHESGEYRPEAVPSTRPVAAG